MLFHQPHQHHPSVGGGRREGKRREGKGRGSVAIVTDGLTGWRVGRQTDCPSSFFLSLFPFFHSFIHSFIPPSFLPSSLPSRHLRSKIWCATDLAKPQRGACILSFLSCPILSYPAKKKKKKKKKKGKKDLSATLVFRVTSRDSNSRCTHTHTHTGGWMGGWMGAGTTRHSSLAGLRAYVRTGGGGQRDIHSIYAPGRNCLRLVCM